jgi:hypothetical protein
VTAVDEAEDEPPDGRSERQGDDRLE